VIPVFSQIGGLGIFGVRISQTLSLVFMFSSMKLLTLRHDSKDNGVFLVARHTFFVHFILLKGLYRILIV
jgi:hypothetical protein